MRAYDIDERFPPLMRVEWHRTPTDDEFEAYLADLLAQMKRVDATRRIMVLDSTSGAAITPAQRRMKSEWIEKNRALIAQRTIAIVFIYDSAILRGMLTAVLWFAPLPAPHVVCATRAEAIECCERLLQQQSFPMPRGVREAWLAPQLKTAARR